MSEKLNEEYFKTKEEHEKALSPYAWGFIAVLVLSFIIATVNIVKEDEKQKNEKIESIEDTDKGIMNALNEAPRTTEDAKVQFGDLGFEIELHKNLRYAKYPNQNIVIVHSLDSVKLSYLIGEIPGELKIGGVEKNWKTHLLEGNNSYQFRDSINLTFLSVENSNEGHKGFYKIDKSENNYFIVQASIVENEYEENFDKMMDVINSFKRIK